ncbi:MAG: hypothetical protein K0M45_02890 [Candidatus Paracaedibacteraceae bacterium]|nr:hypothetical protein [Candidatus Paracaedibacteraceae bacterium]
MAPEILRALREENLPKEIVLHFKELNDKYQSLIKEELSLAQLYSKELGYGEGKVENLDELLDDESLSEATRNTIVIFQDRLKANIEETLIHARSKEIYLSYTKSFKTRGTAGSGWLTHTPNQDIEATIGATGLYDAIAYLHGINLYIWQVPAGDTVAKLIHWYENKKNNRSAHVLHNGWDHYDMLNCHEEMLQVEELTTQESPQPHVEKSTIEQRREKKDN